MLTDNQLVCFVNNKSLLLNNLLFFDQNNFIINRLRNDPVIVSVNLCCALIIFLL